MTTQNPDASNLPDRPDAIEQADEFNSRITRRIRSFVVRAGRMTAGQERAWQELWPIYGIDFNGQPLDVPHCFGRSAPVTLEIGFGTGDALLNYAQLNPDRNCIGIEVHPPGVGHLMLHVHDKKLGNVRVMCRDVVDVLSQSLGAATLDEVHIFFPDPWHKTRHHKRRLIQPPFIDLLARVMKLGGVLKLATDWEHYAIQMRTVLDAHSSFASIASSDSQSQPGYAARPEHRPLTRFERRGHRLGHGVWDLAYARK